MTPDAVRRTLLAASCVSAPVFGLVAAFATPALATDATGEMRAIAASPDRFYVYALCMLLSSILLVPAVFALLDLVRPHRPWGTLLAGVAAQIGMLVAIGDSASELVFWQMGAHQTSLPAMITVAEDYENAPGASLIYMVGGLCTLGGLIALGVLLWRAHALAPWAAVALPVGAIANIVGFGMASRPLLVGSYLILAVALVPAALKIRQPQPAMPAPMRGRASATAS